MVVVVVPLASAGSLAGRPAGWLPKTNNDALLAGWLLPPYAEILFSPPSSYHHHTRLFHQQQVVVVVACLGKSKSLLGKKPGAIITFSNVIR